MGGLDPGEGGSGRMEGFEAPHRCGDLLRALRPRTGPSPCPPMSLPRARSTVWSKPRETSALFRPFLARRPCQQRRGRRALCPEAAWSRLSRDDPALSASSREIPGESDQGGRAVGRSPVLLKGCQSLLGLDLTPLPFQPIDPEIRQSEVKVAWRTVGSWARPICSAPSLRRVQHR